MMGSTTESGATNPHPSSTPSKGNGNALYSLPATLTLLFIGIAIAGTVFWFLRRRKRLARQKVAEETESNKFIDEVAPLSTFATLKQDKEKEEKAGFHAGSHLVCAICLETMQDSDTVRQLPCGHVFHSKGIVRWFKGEHDCCPLCNSSVLKSEDISPV